MKRVYIAGPIRGGDRLHNLNQALVAYRALMARGHAPMCPHLNMLAAYGFNGQTDADWLAVDLCWVEVCEVVLRLPGESAGADAETALANRLGIPVVHSVEEV